MRCFFPFGQPLHRLVQQDQSPKEIFVLGVYASAIHAKWVNGNDIVCQALAVASEPYIFWNGDIEEAKSIIEGIHIPQELGQLIPANQNLNGPSAKVLDERILRPLGYTREQAWLCDMLPETRLNSNQVNAIREKYNPHIEKYFLNPVTVPAENDKFCDKDRCVEITAEIKKSQAKTLILLGDKPIQQYLKKVADIDFNSLKDYSFLYGYGQRRKLFIDDLSIDIMPIAHPRQIGKLGASNAYWADEHLIWETSLFKDKP